MSSHIIFKGNVIDITDCNFITYKENCLGRMEINTYDEFGHVKNYPLMNNKLELSLFSKVDKIDDLKNNLLNNNYSFLQNVKIIDSKNLITNSQFLFINKDKIKDIKYHNNNYIDIVNILSMTMRIILDDEFININSYNLKKLYDYFKNDNNLIDMNIQL